MVRRNENTEEEKELYSKRTEINLIKNIFP